MTAKKPLSGTKSCETTPFREGGGRREQRGRKKGVMRGRGAESHSRRYWAGGVTNE